MTFSNKNKVIYLIAIPIIMGFIVYANSLNAPFQYDDHDTIMQNKDIRVISDIKSIFTHSLFRPILFFTFALNYHISGINPFSYHLFNIILHLINILLVFLISHTLFKTLSTGEDSHLHAFITSLLFAVHPIGTEAVTYISSRSSVLATFFFLSAFYIYLHTYHTAHKLKRIFLYSTTILLFFLGAGSKEIILTLPIIIIITDIFLLKLNLKETLKRIFTTHISFVIIIIIGIVLRIYFFLSYEKVGGTLPRSIYENLLTQSEVIIKYIRLLILPFGQNLIHNYPTVRSILNLYTILCIFTIFILIRYAVKNIYNKPVISFGILWFFITLLPSSSFIPFQEAMTEKHLYLPMFGFFLVVSYLTQFIIKTERLPKIYSKSIIALIFLVLSSLTIYRNYLWGDSIRLWEDIVKKSPDSWATHYAYADALRKQAENDIINSFKSYQLKDIGISQEYMNRYTRNLIKAIKHYIESALLRPAYTDAILNTGICFGMLFQITKSEKDLLESERFFKIVRELEPNNTKALNNLANLYLLTGKYDAAISLYNDVLKLDEKNVNALSNLAQIYLNITKDFTKAKDVLSKLLDIYKYYREFDKVKEIEETLYKIEHN
ncbi:MAG: tetratricopeptide repeat protein [Deltaproteobacteria bacterium]|nr:tetratricopeptide repeat protein [Deltaproteobacteria bacterium]